MESEIGPLSPMERLIREVRQHPSLWDTSSEKYNDLKQREADWLLVQAKLGKPAYFLKREWKKLRDCYRQALIRRTGRNNKFPQWRFEKQMQFLLPVISKRRPRMSLAELSMTPDKWKFDLEVDDTPLNDEDSVSIPLLEASVVYAEEPPNTIIDFIPSSPPPWHQGPLDEITTQTAENFPEDNKTIIPPTHEKTTSETQWEPKRAKRKTANTRTHDLDRLIAYLQQKDNSEWRSNGLDSLDHFFASACLSTRNLPRTLQASVKRQILDIIDKAEEKAEQLLLRTDDEKSSSYSAETEYTINDGTIHIGDNGEVLLKHMIFNCS